MKKKLIVLLTASVVAFGFSFTFAKGATKGVKKSSDNITTARVWDDG